MSTSDNCPGCVPVCALPTAPEDATENIRKMGTALVEIAAALKPFDNAARIRIIRATAILQGIDLAKR